mmetsp:Transcript_6589/g.18396  ORF Transcript_6589/g.18396 Transcript_6589/m.18396 type:complete len:679 (+) Transcript_6589:93-2129(+)
MHSRRRCRESGGAGADDLTSSQSTPAVVPANSVAGDDLRRLPAPASVICPNYMPSENRSAAIKRINSVVLACIVLCLAPEYTRAYTFHRNQPRHQATSPAAAASVSRSAASAVKPAGGLQMRRQSPLRISPGIAFVSANNRRAAVGRLFSADDEDEYEEYDEDEYVEDEYVPLEEDPDDPNYTAQKELLEKNLPRLQALSVYKKMIRDQVEEDGITDALDKTLDEFFEENLTKEELKELEMKVKAYEINEEDIEELTEEDIEEAAIEFDGLEGEDAFPEDGPTLEAATATNEMLVSIDDAAKEYYAKKKAMEDGTYEGLSKFDALDEEEELSKLNSTDPEQYDELLYTIKEMEDDDRPMYKPEKMLIYDLQFNMTNIFLAACKHNPDAPIILPQWLYQMEVYERYAADQERNFEFTWDETESVDMSELEKYWQGLGYDEIPTKDPSETNIIDVGIPDDDEIQMSHMQEWMREVYDPEFDEVFFDDDNFMPYDSVYSEEFYEKETPKDITEWDEMMSDIHKSLEEGDATEEEAEENLKFVEKLVENKDFTERITYDSPEGREFQGHLVVACSAKDADLEIAEKITTRMSEDFGLKIFVETRVYGHAKPEDFLFEVWLESYDIDLIHSKRKATLSSQTWEGPSECDDAQIEYLVDQVGYLISDDHRYSYRIFEYEGIEEG